MTVIQYCREEAKWRDLVIIRANGWVKCSAYIEHKNLLRLPPDIANAEVVGAERGWIRIANRLGGRGCPMHLSRYQIGKLKEADYDRYRILPT